LEGKARKPREQGIGKRPDKANSLTKEEERMGGWSVRQPNPSFFDKHSVVAANNAFWFT